MQQIQWQDRFNIGVEVVDQAHRRLFSIVEKIMELYVERHEDRFACVEGIKYFKAYAVKHFAEEEAYMREIGYPGYLVHKRLHDRMRRETLPALERELYASNFSTEAVQHFIGVCIGWLTGHIMIEDRAITGEHAALSRPSRDEDERSLIQAVIVQPLQEILGLPIRYLGPYTQDALIRDARYCQLACRDEDGQELRFVLVIGEDSLLQAAGLMFGMEFYAVNEIVRFAIREIAQSLIQRAAVHFGLDSDACRVEEVGLLDARTYHASVQAHAPQYSLLFGAGQDRFALCVHRLPAQGEPPPHDRPT